MTIATLDDIKKVISLLSDGEPKTLQVKTNVNWYEDGKNKTQEVITESKDINAKRILIEGMNVVKSKIDFITEAMKDTEDDDLMPEKIRWNIKLSDIDKQFFNVDGFIKKRFGGYRKGLKVRWDVKEGTYEYDPYTSALNKVE